MKGILILSFSEIVFTFKYDSNGSEKPKYEETWISIIKVKISSRARLTVDVNHFIRSRRKTTFLNRLHTSFSRMRFFIVGVDADRARKHGMDEFIQADPCQFDHASLFKMLQTLTLDYRLNDLFASLVSDGSYAGKICGSVAASQQIGR